MNQYDLAQIVRNKDRDISVTLSTAIVAAIFNGITDAMERGEEIRITKFGAFSVAKRPARRGRNPRTGEEIDIPAKRVPRFNPFDALRDALNPAPRVGGRRMSPASGDQRARA